MLSVEMLWSARAAEFSQQRLNPSIPRENLVIGGMQRACRRSAKCISFSRLLFLPFPFFQASITGDYSPLIVSFPLLFTAGAGMSLALSFPLSMPLSTSLTSFSHTKGHGASEKPSEWFISLNSFLLPLCPPLAPRGRLVNEILPRQPLRFQ